MRVRRRVLFVCVENACRSQMAEGFARRFAPAGVEVYSSGSRPSGQVNPRARQFMAEIGVDLAAHQSKALAELPVENFDVVITMGCGDRCPVIPALERADWPLPDPKHLADDEFRAVRDEIQARVRALMQRLAEPSAG